MSDQAIGWGDHVVDVKVAPDEVIE